MISSSIRIVQSVVLTGLLVGISACTSTAPAPVESSETTAEIPPPMNINRQTAIAKTDLAQRLDVDPDSVVVSSSRSVTWRSGALGCPEPGMMYTQALVPGTVIYLKVEATIHAYHARFAGEPFYCPRERVEPPAADGNDLT